MTPCPVCGFVGDGEGHADWCEADLDDYPEPDDTPTVRIALAGEFASGVGPAVTIDGDGRARVWRPGDGTPAGFAYVGDLAEGGPVFTRPAPPPCTDIRHWSSVYAGRCQRCMADYEGPSFRYEPFVGEVVSRTTSSWPHRRVWVGDILHRETDRTRGRGWFHVGEHRLERDGARWAVDVIQDVRRQLIPLRWWRTQYIRVPFYRGPSVCDGEPAGTMQLAIQPGTTDVVVTLIGGGGGGVQTEG